MVIKNYIKILHEYYKALVICFVLCSAVNVQAFSQCPVISSINATATGCGAGSGTASVAASGGTGTLTYLWNPGNKTGPVITGLIARTYTVTVTDAAGCSVTGTATVSPPTGGPTITIDSQKNLKCNGDKNGNVYTSATGGSGNYNYTWSTGNNGTGISSSILNISAGAYYVTYTDINSSCSNTKVIIITEPQPFNMAPVIANIKCKGDANGSINITPSGNTGTYFYDWSPVNKQTEDLTGLQGGTYTLSITDTQGCTATFTYTITEPATSISVSVFSTQATCGQSDGTATANTSGGTGALTYSWSDGSQTYSASNLAAGTYTVVVKDNNGCSATSAITVTCVTGINESDDEMSFSMYPNPALSKITIEITTNKPYTLQLTNLVGEIVYTQQSSVNEATIDIGTLPQGIYIVQVQNMPGTISGRQRLVVQR